MLPVNDKSKWTCILKRSTHLSLFHNVVWVTAGEASTLQQVHDIGFPGTLQWRHNGLDGISNHQPHHCLLSSLFGRRSKKTSKLRVTGLGARNSPGTSEFPAQMASNAENISIWWRHHDNEVCSAHITVFNPTTQLLNARQIIFIITSTWSSMINQFKRLVLKWQCTGLPHWNPETACRVFPDKHNSVSYIDGLAQDCRNSSALAMELLQSCSVINIKPIPPKQTKTLQLTDRCECIKWQKVKVFI